MFASRLLDAGITGPRRLCQTSVALVAISEETHAHQYHEIGGRAGRAADRRLADPVPKSVHPGVDEILRPGFCPGGYGAHVLDHGCRSRHGHAGQQPLEDRWLLGYVPRHFLRLGDAPTGAVIVARRLSSGLSVPLALVLPRTRHFGQARRGRAHGRKWRFSDVVAASDFYFNGRLIDI